MSRRYLPPTPAPLLGSPGEAGASWLTPEQFTYFRDILAAYSGVHLDLTRQRLLEHSLARRLAATGDQVDSYQLRLSAAGGRDELRRLAELVLNHETMFFRNGPHFHALRSVLLPELHRRRPAGTPIRIWSAGCATGEEAYSLAITALETFKLVGHRPVEIIATDLSEPALQRARTGVYRGRSLQNVPPEILRRHFNAYDDGYIVDAAVRSLVRFEQINLLEPFPREMQGIDIIFCQNVTIYFQLKTCQQLITRFYECLPSDGLLFLGFSETLWNIFDRFRTREIAGAYVYSKESPTTPVIASPPAAGAPPVPARASRSRAGHSTSVPERAKSRRAAHAPAHAAHAEPGPQRAQNDRTLLAQGHTLLAQGRFDEALEILRHIAPHSALAPAAITLVARAHADRGDLDLAAAEVQRVIEIDTLHAEAYLLLGIIYSRQGQWANSIQQLERARYLNAELELVSFYLAEAYRQASRHDRAAAEYRNTLQKLDKHPPGALLDGVAVSWLRETCQRHIDNLLRSTLSNVGA